MPRVHGCSLFTRGETQAIAVVTLGGDSDAQRVDEMTGQDKDTLRRFSLHYFFPPNSVGEVRSLCAARDHASCAVCHRGLASQVGRVGAPSRRELGHGNLAERALLPILPAQAEVSRQRHIAPAPAD